MPVAQAELAGCIPYYLGYSLTHPIALEAALKLEEITRSAAHCEGMFSSEFKHGPLRAAAVHDGYPVLFITAPGDESMMINPVLPNRNEVTTRGGRAIALAAEKPALRANVHDRIRVVVPDCDRLFFPILLTLPGNSSPTT